MIGIAMSYQNMKKQKENQYKQKIEKVTKEIKSGVFNFVVLTKLRKSLYFIYKDFFYGNKNENSKIK